MEDECIMNSVIVVSEGCLLLTKHGNVPESRELTSQQALSVFSMKTWLASSFKAVERNVIYFFHLFIDLISRS